MLYFSFVLWLMRKAYTFFARFPPLYGSSTARYNLLNESRPLSAPTGRLAVTAVALIFLGTPMAGYVWLVSVLPIPFTAQWLILLGSGVVVLIVTGRYLLRHATKRR